MKERSPLVEYLQTQQMLGTNEVFLSARNIPLPTGKLVDDLVLKKKLNLSAQPVQPEDQGPAPEVQWSMKSRKDNINSFLADIQQSADLDEYHQHLHQCPLFEELHAQYPIIYGQGRMNPGLMILDYMPNDENSKLRTHFFGDAGNIVKKMVEALNYDYELCYKTYLVKQKQVKSLLPRDKKTARELFKIEINLVKPQTLLVFGDECFQSLFQIGETVHQAGGGPRSFEGIPTWVTFNPNQLQQNTELKGIAWHQHLLGFRKFREDNSETRRA